MNQYTLWTTSNAGDVVKRCTRDRWVYHEDDCFLTEFQYVTTADQANGLHIDMTYDTCFSLNTKLYSDSPGIWSATDMNKRYKQVKN